MSTQLALKSLVDQVICMTINFAKWRAIGLISFGICLVLANFQNCAPPNSDASANSNLQADPQLRVVDDWNQLKVDILDSVIQASPTDSQVKVDGYCDRHNHQDLSWAVTSTSAGELIRGSAKCERGGFRIILSNLDGLNCGEAYDLSVVNDQGDRDSGILVRACGQ